MIHDFRERLEYGERSGHEPFWDAVYRKAFPNLVCHMTTGRDNKAQRIGVDRVLLLDNGRTLYIDEKKREKDYPDILLEFLSNDRTNAPGWIEKDLALDFLAYAFMSSKTVHLFPWLMLRRAWRHYRDEWLLKYPEVKAQNKTYATFSVAVPTKVLRQAVSLAAVIQL